VDPVLHLIGAAIGWGDLDAHSLNNLAAKPNPDGSFPIHFGGDSTVDPDFCIPFGEKFHSYSCPLGTPETMKSCSTPAQVPLRENFSEQRLPEQSQGLIYYVDE
jgi:hypothetical protein